MHEQETNSVSGPEAHPAQTLHLIYHELSPEPRQYTYITDTGCFAEHLALFGRLQSAPLQPRITFDDGHSSAHKYALPLLAVQNLKATFFITAGWTGTKPGYMGWDELRALQQAGHTIGAHGWSHALLTHCSDAELRHELLDSRSLLEDKLGTAVNTLSFPGGRFDAQVLDACEEAGYTQMFTSSPSVATVTSDKLIGRLNMRRGASAAWLEELFEPDSLLLAKMQRQERIKSFARKLLGDRAYMGLWSLLNKQEMAP